MLYTIQSRHTGKFITSLFSFSDRDTFSGRTIHESYVWADREEARKVAQEKKGLLVAVQGDK